MKVLYIDDKSEYYLYPDGVQTIDEFAEFLENYNKKFIKLRHLFERKCVAPYFILEEIDDVYVHINQIGEFFEMEAVVLERVEYEKMLNNVKKKLCSHCEDKDECLSDKKEEYREKLCLDGSCYAFCEEE